MYSCSVNTRASDKTLAGGYDAVVVNSLGFSFASLYPCHDPDPVLSTYTLLWGSIGEPFKMKLTGNAEYLYSFTQGFSKMPSPAQVRGPSLTTRGCSSHWLLVVVYFYLL